MKRKILLTTAGIVVLSAALIAIFGDDGDLLLFCLLLLLLPLGGVSIWFLSLLVSLPLWLIDRLVFKDWLGRKSDKYDQFYELSTLWLTRPYKLPFRMCKRGAKYGWLGAGLLLVSPLAIATYTMGYCFRQEFYPCPLSEEAVPHNTHQELVAITGLQDFPAFTYSHNSRDGWDGSVAIYYKFDKKLSSAYAKKLEALCEDPDNYLWEKGDSCYVLHRGVDGKYIKSSVDGGQTLTIFPEGFIIKGWPEYPSPIEDFAEKDSLNKKAGVTFPKYKMVNYYCDGSRDYNVYYYLMLDERPSKRFIKRLENSPKWTKKKDGTYSCRWGEDNQYSEEVTVDKNSRVVKAIYRTY